MESLRSILRPARIIALIAGLLCVVLGIILFQRYEDSQNLSYKLLGLFISELGFAFIIAVMIFIILEEEATREHSMTVLGYLYGVDPKGKFFDKLETCILKQRYYRDKTLVTYRFEERDDESLLVRYTIEYTVTNVSRKVGEGFILRGALDKKPIHTGRTPWDDRLGVWRVDIDDEEVPLNELKITKGNSELCQCYEAKPILLQPNSKARVKVVHQLVKHDHDSEVWHGTIPCMGVELRVEWPPQLDMRFAAEAIHPDGGAMREQRGPGKLKLILNEPFMTHHGIHFKWYRCGSIAAKGVEGNHIGFAGPQHD